jgi:hypothetical protein
MKVFDVLARNGQVLAEGLTLREANALALELGGYVRPRIVGLAVR